MRKVLFCSVAALLLACGDTSDGSRDDASTNNGDTGVAMPDATTSDDAGNDAATPDAGSPGQDGGDADASQMDAGDKTDAMLDGEDDSGVENEDAATGDADVDASPVADWRDGLYVNEDERFYFYVTEDDQVTDITYEFALFQCDPGVLNFHRRTSWIPVDIVDDEFSTVEADHHDIKCQFLEDGRAACRIDWTEMNAQCVPQTQTNRIDGSAYHQHEMCDSGGVVVLTPQTPDSGEVVVDVEVLPWGGSGCDGPVADGTEVEFGILGISGGAAVDPSIATTVDGKTQITVSGTGTSVTLRIQVDGPLGETHSLQPQTISLEP
jgi:hypothetical protein